MVMYFKFFSLILLIGVMSGCATHTVRQYRYDTMDYYMNAPGTIEYREETFPYFYYHPQYHYNYHPHQYYDHPHHNHYPYVIHQHKNRVFKFKAG